MGSSFAFLIKKFGTYGKEPIVSDYKSLWEIPVKDIDGNSYETLGELKPGVKALLIVNVASKWKLAEVNYP